MKFKGTKGKWSVDKSGYRTTKGGLCVMNDNQCIAVIGDGNPHHPIEANALLISKAPEMLEMLEIIYQQVDFSFSNWSSDTGLKMEEKIKQLIKEATEL